MLEILHFAKNFCSRAIYFIRSKRCISPFFSLYFFFFFLNKFEIFWLKPAIMNLRHFPLLWMGIFWWFQKIWKQSWSFWSKDLIDKLGKHFQIETRKPLASSQMDFLDKTYKKRSKEKKWTSPSNLHNFGFLDKFDPKAVFSTQKKKKWKSLSNSTYLN